MKGSFLHCNPNEKRTGAFSNLGAPVLCGLSDYAAGELVVIIDAGLEHALAHAAERAAPVIGKILKCRSGSDAVLGITFLRIIGITTGITKKFLHKI